MTKSGSIASRRDARPDSHLGAKARRLLISLCREGRVTAPDKAALHELIADDLVVQDAAGMPRITQAGRAHAARLHAEMAGAGAGEAGSAPGAFRAQHMSLVTRDIAGALETGGSGAIKVLVNDSESPLAWLARRKAKDGRAMIEPVQFVAGERLRADFTRAQLSPRVTSNWSSPMASGRGGGAGGAHHATDLALAARQRVRAAMQAVGPEFSGPLMDVCCFLHGLEQIERERGWPPRSAKVVLQLGLDRLARHYGLMEEARGAAHARLRTWLAEDASFTA